MSHFIQIHTLTSYPGTLLNRDDAGFAKRLPFGGASRTRVSSQCLKRHWRTFGGQHSLGELDQGKSLRSRHTFELRIARPLREEYPAMWVNLVVNQLMELVLSGKFKKSLSEDLKTGQITVLGEPEVDFLKSNAATVLEAIKAAHPTLLEVDEAFEELPKKAKKGEEGVVLQGDVAAAVNDTLATTFDKDARKNLRGLGLAMGLEAALFGRMSTSDLLARGDAAIHVAHALTVHAEESESDYFSAIDDLLGELSGADGDEVRGSGHINSTELTSGLYYGYVVVDVPLLVSNLEGVSQDAWKTADLTLTKAVIERLVHLVATVSPGAKLGSTAPHSRASCVLVEAGGAQPRTLANAFMKPVSTAPDVLANSYDAMTSYLSEYKEMYGASEGAAIAAMGDTDALTQVLEVQKTSVASVAEWAAQTLDAE